MEFVASHAVADLGFQSWVFPNRRKYLVERYKEFTIAQIKGTYSPNKRCFITKGNYKGEMGNSNC